MDTYERINELNLREEEIFPLSFSIKKRLLVEDEKWEILAKTLTNVCKDLYEYRLLDKKVIDVQAFCDSTTDEERLRVNMIFESPEGEQRTDLWKNYPDQ